MKEIIETALRAGCNVDGPKLMDDFALKATHFKQGGAFEDVLRSLRQFSYVTLQDTEDGLHTIWMQQHWMVISEILQHAASLQEFDLTLSNLSAEVHLGSALADLCTTVFTTAEVPCLRTLCLCEMTVSKDALAHILVSCAGSLMTCRLENLFCTRRRRRLGRIGEVAEFDALPGECLSEEPIQAAERRDARTGFK